MPLNDLIRQNMDSIQAKLGSLFAQHKDRISQDYHSVFSNLPVQETPYSNFVNTYTQEAPKIANQLAEAIANPGSTFASPLLKQTGNPILQKIAPIVGLGIDVAAPGPGELGKLAEEAQKYKSAEEFVKANLKSNSWSEAQKSNPDLWNTGILRRSQEPNGAKGVIPKEVHSAQTKWQNYGQYSEIEAGKVYDKIDNYGYYLDKEGNTIRDVNGNALQNNTKFGGEDALVSNEQLKQNLIDSFSTPEGKKYLGEVINALPKNPDGSITAYRIGGISEGGLQSYTLSEGMAKTFSNQGTDILPAGTPGLPKRGYKDFGSLPINVVKIDPKGIKAWSPYDAEILVEPKHVKTKSQLTDIWNKAKGGNSIKEIGRGEFGKIYTNLNPKKAIDILLKEKGGEAKEVINHPELGKIDLIYGKPGKNGYGLAHIESEHPDALPSLDKILTKGKLIGGGNTRKYIESPDGKALISLNWLGKEKRWVLTAFSKNPVLGREDF